MAQPVKVGDALIEAARAAAEDNYRSTAAQIEHWALLGRAVEKALTLGDTVALKRSEGQLDASARSRIAEALSNALDPVRSAIAKTAVCLRDAIRYETDPALPGLLIANGRPYLRVDTQQRIRSADRYPGLRWSRTFTSDGVARNFQIPLPEEGR